ncbi:MAG: transglutaminase domain-containing protein [Desulfurococcales archaeon]|nr:transglutaminase domain-containing protein [Desulfurococcales archaeon]
MVKAIRIGIIVILIILSANMMSFGVSSTNTDLEDIRVLLKGTIKNNGNNTIFINETDLLVFDYPLNTSTQKVRYIKAFVNDGEIPFYIEKYENGYLLHINESSLAKKSIKPGEKVSSSIEYIVEINIGKRLLEIAGLSKSVAKNWSYIVINQTEVNATSLWNHTNPLTSLLVKYIKYNKTINRTPLELTLGLLEWFKRNIDYSSRVPPRQPFEVILDKKGDCDDMSNLLVTILRGSGIPSFLEIGIVYISKEFSTQASYANGLLRYKFIGGGAHGWVVAYIPPWGYIRIDLTFGGTNPISHIYLAAYYTYPTIVLSRIHGGDYTKESAQSIESIVENKVEYDILLVVEELEKQG